jgi:hypothetical protein
MKAWRWVIASALVLIGMTSAWGVNSVVVGSRTCYAGASGVEIGIRVANDLTVCGLVVPLEIRAVTPGAFITSLRLSYGGRLNGVLTGAVVGVQHGVKASTCTGGDQGYGDLVSDGLNVSHAVGTSPEGAMFVRARWTAGDLQPGADLAPSMLLTVNVTNTLGTFEIDTTCMVPNNHLMFAVNCPTTQAVVPAFTKGVVTIDSFPIVDCNCPNQGDVNPDGVVDLFDVIQEIAIAFSGAPDIQDAMCPTTRGDVDRVNSPGVTDVMDVIRIIAIAYSGGIADNPCAP